MPITPRKLLIPGALLSTLLLATPAIATAQQEPPSNRLDVQAQAEVQVVPDKATLNARLWEVTPAIARREDEQANADVLAKARQRLEDRAAELIRTLEEAGLDKDSITAGSLSVHPEFIRDEPKADADPMTLVRTRLERPFNVEISNLEDLPTILDALTSAGVNSLDGVTYDLSDRQQASDEALTKALEKAQRKAELMANTLGVSLGPVVNVSEQHAPIFQPRMMAMGARATQESAGNATEYRPGTITLDATVNVGWEISPENR